ncbi:hypothetical protein [Streptomyces halstedii]|uniref:hypothetical protein n=1 Tax=Streptomyces halstedii TaxID=1944 RepID=UPI003803802C
MGADADAEFEGPVGAGGPSVFSGALLALALFGCGDLLPHAVEGHSEPGFQGAEAGQIWR